MRFRERQIFEKKTLLSVSVTSSNLFTKAAQKAAIVLTHRFKDTGEIEAILKLQ